MDTGKKVLLGCGICVGIFIILISIGLFWLFTGPEGGTKLSNEMEQYAVEYIDQHQILNPSEKLVAYYDATISLKGTEAAILTTKRIIYHKDGRNESIDLASITDIKHRNESLIGDIFEIFSDSGQSMKIEIAPFNQGETFKTALMNAWGSAKR